MASATPTHKRALAGIGYVPQGRGILQKFTVRENILLGTFARTDRQVGDTRGCLELFPYWRQSRKAGGNSIRGQRSNSRSPAPLLPTQRF